MSKIKDIKPNPETQNDSKLPYRTHQPGSFRTQILSVRYPKSKPGIVYGTCFIIVFQVKIPSDFHMLKMMVWEISNNAAVIKLTIHSLLLAAKIK